MKKLIGIAMVAAAVMTSCHAEELPPPRIIIAEMPHKIAAQACDKLRRKDEDAWKYVFQEIDSADKAICLITIPANTPPYIRQWLCGFFAAIGD